MFSKIQEMRRKISELNLDLVRESIKLHESQPTSVDFKEILDIDEAFECQMYRLPKADQPEHTVVMVTTDGDPFTVYIKSVLDGTGNVQTSVSFPSMSDPNKKKLYDCMAGMNWPVVDDSEILKVLQEQVLGYHLDTLNGQFLRPSQMQTITKFRELFDSGKTVVATLSLDDVEYCVSVDSQTNIQSNTSSVSYKISNVTLSVTAPNGITITKNMEFDIYASSLQHCPVLEILRDEVADMNASTLKWVQSLYNDWFPWRYDYDVESIATCMSLVRILPFHQNSFKDRDYCSLRFKWFGRVCTELGTYDKLPYPWVQSYLEIARSFPHEQLKVYEEPNGFYIYAYPPYGINKWQFSRLWDGQHYVDKGRKTEMKNRAKLAWNLS